MIEEEYVALYRAGDCQLLGAVRAGIVDSLLVDLNLHSRENYWTKPITPEQAQQIRENIARCSEGVEKLLARKTE